MPSYNLPDWPEHRAEASEQSEGVVWGHDPVTLNSDDDIEESAENCADDDEAGVTGSSLSALFIAQLVTVDCWTELSWAGGVSLS